MNTTFNQDKSELGILILTITVQMLAHGYGLLDKHVKIFRNLRRKALGFEDAQDLASGHCVHLSDTLRITQVDADLGGNEALLGKLADLIGYFFGGGLQP